MERRLEKRDPNSLKTTPLWCSLVVGAKDYPLEVINFHHKGACFRIHERAIKITPENAHLSFFLGNSVIPEKLQFRVVWETIAENGLFGVELQTSSHFHEDRAGRFASNSINSPVLTAADPIDPNRTIYFKAVNISTSGMLLTTSFANRHILPGMELRAAILEIPSIGKTEIDLYVENTRSLSDSNSIAVGVSVRDSAHSYVNLISRYLSAFGEVENRDERLEALSKANLVSKNLKDFLSIREIKTQEEYKQVLELRHLAYRKAEKVIDDTTPADMGDGLENEGVVLGGFLGGQLVASVDLRLSRIHKIRVAKLIDIEKLRDEVNLENFAEFNKLVVHPSAQKTDVVLGLLQKIHALAMLNGQPDGIILADDKLVNLYRRLGFKRTKMKFPHPVKQGLSLNVMIMDHETYASAKGMNPYAWDVVYSATQRFFEHTGVTPKLKFSLFSKATKSATALLYRIKSKRKKKYSMFDGKRTSTGRQRVIEPKWTSPHFHASVVLPYVLESKRLIGTEQTTRILLRVGFTEDYFRSNTNWVSIEFFNYFIEEFGKLEDPVTLHRAAGYRTTTQEILGTNYYVLKHFLTPATAFKSMGYFFPKFNKTRIYQVTESSSRHCRIRLLTPDVKYLPTHPAAEANWLAIIDAYVKLLTGAPAQIEVVRSSWRGDPYCEYLVKWRLPIFTTRNLLVLGSSAVGFNFLVAALKAGKVSESLQHPYILAAFTTVGLALIISAWRFREKYLNMIDVLRRFEGDADDRYKELQSSKSTLEKGYQEGKVLEKINTDISRSEDLSGILDTALKAVCTSFEFQRAFLMLTDEKFNFLRTASVFGRPEEAEKLWQFKVDIRAKRENPMVLSSVYHSGQSILISDINEHKFQLNDVSRALIEKLQTKSFAMVPIPSDEKNWGVLIADKGREGGAITRRDLVAMQRVAQSLGLALDKKSKVEHEIKVRQIFQKFVPGNVVEQTLGIAEPTLGGQSKDAICLFMDIRNFTTFSESVPPEVLCEILNRIFDALHDVTHKAGGVIDKFLGDGALVTWGAVPGTVVDCNLAVAAAQEFLKKVEAIDLELTAKGLMSLKVGIGIHKGKVIAGNIGNQQRMEFTVIGNTVNKAARLEQLTKVLKSDIVISSEVYELLSIKENWEIHRDVSVRGVEKLMTVAAFSSVEVKKQGVA